jgi:hypothetical protein
VLGSDEEGRMVRVGGPVERDLEGRRHGLVLALWAAVVLTGMGRGILW